MKKLFFSNPTSSARASLGLLILRLAFGLFMVIGHGWGKLINFGDKVKTFSDPLGIGSTASLSGAVFTEVVCALMLTIGLFSRFSAAALAFTMAVAAFIVHGADPFGRKEMALLYLAAYVVLLITGPGKYSLDEKLK
jgi:putative oxidoreductase